MVCFVYYGEKMNKFINRMVIFAGKMSSNRYLTVIRDAFITVMPIIIGSSFCTLINSVFLGKGHYLDQWFHFKGQELVNMFAAISSAGMSALTLLIVFWFLKIYLVIINLMLFPIR